MTGPEFPALWPAGCVVHRHLTAIGIEIGYGENQADFWRRAADVKGQIEAGQKQCTSEEACGLTTDWCRVHSSRDEAPEGGLFAAVHLQKGIRWRAVVPNGGLDRTLKFWQAPSGPEREMHVLGVGF